ncbi:MAG: ABC transporter substrate-binding protein, partial [Myxococcales bacterium]|nr:ABC transporter substrate-binding protein [Myxococcales bacterium]
MNERDRPRAGRRLGGLAPSCLPLLLTCLVACGAGEGELETDSEGEAAPEAIRIAVLMPLVDGDSLPNLEWALEGVNAAGGVAGRPLALDYFDPRVEDLYSLAAELAGDDEHVAVIGPAGSAALAEVADLFLEANKPLISTTSTSDDLLRAYGGKDVIWRTRESDIAQTELLVRYAKGGGAERVTLLTSLDIAGYTFFTWFGFFARELGFADDDVQIVTFASDSPCDAQLMEVLEDMPDMVIVAAGSPEQMDCVALGLPPPGAARPRIVFADTGFDPYALERHGALAAGLEGFTGAGDERFEEAYLERFPGERLSPHGPSEYDAVLLLAYGLERAGGRGGVALIEGMKDAVDGDEALAAVGPDADGIAATLAAMRAGGRPRLRGASGPLVFEPELYMDLASSTLAHYQLTEDGLALDLRLTTDDPTFLTSQGVFVRPRAAPPDVDQSAWSPAVAKTETWAVIAALSSGFSNYRHQADAL